MIIKILSDHPGGQLQKIDQQAQAERQAAAAHRAAVSQLRQENAGTRRWWQMGVRQQHRREERAFEAQAPQGDPRLADDRAIVQAGVSAEGWMTAALDQALSDDWTLLRGYKNGSGEIDHLLIGPGGVWAIEVKNSAWRITVHGDEWIGYKYDKYGNYLNQTKRMTDGKGRSWGREVAEPADRFQAFLAKRGVHVPVYRAVVIFGAKARFIEIGDDVKVFCCLGADPFLQGLRTYWRNLDPATRQSVINLAEDDHERHKKPRPPRRKR